VRPAPRSRARRKTEMLALLLTEVDCRVSHDWDGAALVLATPRSLPTATNLLRAQGGCK